MIVKKSSNLFRNLEGRSKLVLKRATKNIRMGYKILRGDSAYDELYKDQENEDEFLCCKEYKKYVENLVLSHKIENCNYDHKDGLQYLCEMALNELSNIQSEDEVENIEEISCNELFCNQCNLCMMTQMKFDSGH